MPVAALLALLALLLIAHRRLLVSKLFFSLERNELDTFWRVWQKANTSHHEAHLSPANPPQIRISHWYSRSETCTYNAYVCMSRNNGNF